MTVALREKQSESDETMWDPVLARGVGNNERLRQATIRAIEQQRQRLEDLKVSQGRRPSAVIEKIVVRATCPLLGPSLAERKLQFITMLAM